MNSKRKIYNSLLPALVFIAAAFTVLLLVIIIGFVLFKGLPELSWSLLTSVPSGNSR